LEPPEHWEQAQLARLAMPAAPAELLPSDLCLLHMAELAAAVELPVRVLPAAMEQATTGLGEQEVGPVARALAGELLRYQHLLALVELVQPAVLSAMEVALRLVQELVAEAEED
jgi:hypothetical protein